MPGWDFLVMQLFLAGGRGAVASSASKEGQLARGSSS